MSDIWNTVNLPCPVCKVPRRPEDSQCRRCGHPFEVARAAAGPSLSRAPTSPRLVLRQLSPSTANGQTWQVSDAPAEVGRDRGTIMLRDKSVSRQHARITPDGSGFIVQDLNSTNGTRVNDQPVVGPSPIRQGDQVAFGDVLLVAEVCPAAGSAATSAAGAPLPPVGITILYDPPPVVARPAVISQPAIDPTLHEGSAGPVDVHTAAVSPPPLDSSFGREVLELAQAADAIAARLRALEAAWRSAQTRGRS